MFIQNGNDIDRKKKLVEGTIHQLLIYKYIFIK